MSIEAAATTKRGPGQFFIEVIEDADRINHPVLRQVYLYWESKRNSRTYPARADLDPIEVPLLLPHLVLIDIRRDPFDLIVRLAGTHVVRGIGREVTGLRMQELPTADVASLIDAYASVAADGQARRIQSTCFIPPDRWPQVDRVVMPLARDGQTPDMLFGGVVFERSAPTWEDQPHWAAYGTRRAAE